jgi:hypothetical protein
MTIEMRLTANDHEFCVDLMGTDDRNTEIELPERVRLRYVKSEPMERGDGTEVLVLLLQVPLNVAASVAAGLLLDRIREAERRSEATDSNRPRVSDVALEDGSRVDLSSPDAQQQLTLDFARNSRSGAAAQKDAHA